MATVNLDKKTFEKEIGKLNEAMQERIALFGTPIESIEDGIVQIEVNPNRPDLLSYSGFKRSFLAFLGKKKGLAKYKVYPAEKDYRVTIDSSVKDIRPYTACAIVKGLKLNDEKIKEIIEIQEKLHLTVGRKRKKVAIGIYPLEKIKLPIVFKAVEPDKIKFIPLESPKEMSGLEILQKHDTGKTYAHLLTGKAKFPIFIDSDNNILSMPPIINSSTVGKVTEKTKDVFIECSGFDLEVLKKTLNIIVTSLAEMGGKIYSMKLNYGSSPDLTPEKRKISLENTNKLLGFNLNEKDLKLYLEKMGHDYSQSEVKIAAWRTDILHEVDLIEDIAIAYGYENIVPEIPSISTIASENPKETIKRKIAEILSGLNMLEISNYHLTNKKDQFTNMNISEKQEEGYVELESSKTEYSILRKNLSHYALKILSENVDAEYPQRIYEIGKVFELKSKIDEHENICIASAPGNFTDMRQFVEYLFRMLNLKIEIKEPSETSKWFIDGRVGEILLENKSIGYLGEINPRTLTNWKIKMPVSLCEIEMKEIYRKLI